MCVGRGNAFVSRPDSRSACLPVLVITVHVFGFIVFASLDSGSARHSCSYPSPVWTSTATQEEYDWVSVPRLYQTDQSLGFSRKLRFGTRAGDEPPHCVNDPFDDCHAHVGYWERMDAEKTIAEIEQLEEMFEAPDIRPLNASDISAANRRHDEMLAHSPWFRLWQQYGVCCRS
jgi:hypothetical protein